MSVFKLPQGCHGEREHLQRFRKDNQNPSRKQLAGQFQRRTFMLIRDVRPGTVETLEFLYGCLSYLLGRNLLSRKDDLSYADDAFEFLHTCSDV